MPKLDLYLTQEKCRYFLTELLGMHFITDRTILVVDADKRTTLELDGYNSDSKIAFEYQGHQHYYYIEYFHSSFEDFLELQKRDKLKELMCKEKNIHLIIIPYYKATSDEDLMKFIMQKVEELGINKSLINYDANLDNFYKNEFIPQQRILLDIIAKNKGKIIGVKYDGQHHNAVIICEEGHEFSPRIGQIIKEFTWCFDCANKYPNRVMPAMQKHMKKTATERGGKCIIEEETYWDWRNKQEKVQHKAKFICKENHNPFSLNKTSFLNGEWCPTCAKPILQQIKLKGGICRKYTPYKRSKINIHCGNRTHKYFQLSEEEIIDGKWCPDCISEINNSI
jgi:hypothetical protein